MSQPKSPFRWPAFKRVVEITMSGAEIVTVEMVEGDVIVFDQQAALRYSISLSHIDRLDARGEAPVAVRIGDRLRGRWASHWYRWEISREIKRTPPALPPAPALEPPAAAAPARRRGRPKKTARLEASAVAAE
jgi:hypothetical protein